MGKFLKKNYLLIIFIIIQTIFYIIAGANKEYLHIDEAYSFGLTHYDKVEIQENSDFFDNWHTKEFVQKINNDLNNVPAVYFLDTGKSSFLDEITLFEKIDKSYIAKDFEFTKENIEKIIKKQDISEGLIIFLHQDRNSEEALNIIKNTSGLQNSEHLKKLSTCNVYYVYN